MAHCSRLTIHKAQGTQTVCSVLRCLLLNVCKTLTLTLEKAQTMLDELAAEPDFQQMVLPMAARSAALTWAELPDLLQVALFKAGENKAALKDAECMALEVVTAALSLRVLPIEELARALDHDQYHPRWDSEQPGVSTIDVLHRRYWAYTSNDVRADERTRMAASFTACQQMTAEQGAIGPSLDLFLLKVKVCIARAYRHLPKGAHMANYNLEGLALAPPKQSSPLKDVDQEHLQLVVKLFDLYDKDEGRCHTLRLTAVVGSFLQLLAGGVRAVLPASKTSRHLALLKDDYFMWFLRAFNEPSHFVLGPLQLVRRMLAVWPSCSPAVLGTAVGCLIGAATCMYVVEVKEPEKLLQAMEPLLPSAVIRSIRAAIWANQRSVLAARAAGDPKYSSTLEAMDLSLAKEAICVQLDCIVAGEGRFLSSSDQAAAASQALERARCARTLEETRPAREAAKAKQEAAKAEQAAAQLLQEEAEAAQAAQRCKQKSAGKKARQKQRKQAQSVPQEAPPSPEPHSAPAEELPASPEEISARRASSANDPESLSPASAQATSSPEALAATWRQRTHVGLGSQFTSGAQTTAFAGPGPGSICIEPGGDDRAAELEDEECVVCWSFAPSVIFQPCGHLCMCFCCAQPFLTGRDCPLCRQHIAAGIILS